MPDDAMTKEQQKFMEQQAKKILDLLVKIAPFPKGAKELYQVAKETKTALDMTVKTFETGRLSASDENMNRLSTIAYRVMNELSKLNRGDEQWWIESSGANLFSKVDTTEGLKRLEAQRKHLLALKEACEGLKTLAGVVFAASVSNVKGLAKLYIPSVPMIDGYVTKDTRDTYSACLNLIDAIVKKQETAIRTTADMEKAIDRFLTLLNTKDQRVSGAATGL
jgi:hypothetical protein